jgi:predicted transcriptional regulator
MSKQPSLHPPLISPDDDIDALIAEGLADFDAGRWIDGEEAFRQLQAHSESQRRAHSS